MPDFQVSSKQSPGVYRQGIGFFAVGETITLPDSATKKGDLLSNKFIPLDKEAHRLLVEHQEKRDMIRENPHKYRHEPPPVVIADVPGETGSDDGPKKLAAAKGKRESDK